MERCIEDTIKYAKQYGCRLSRQELIRRLITNKEWQITELNQVIDKYAGRLDEKPNPWFEGKMIKAQQLANLIERYFPAIKMMAVSGSVASRYPQKDDDIDIFLICQKDTLWVNRLILRLFIRLRRIPHRQFGKQEKKDDFCFNLWMDESEMTLPEKKQTLRNAVDSVLMIPLVNKDQNYERFFGDNPWIRKYCALRYGEIQTVLPPIIKTAKIVKIANWLMYWPQRLFMKKRIKQELVNIKRAFFHNN